MPFFDLALAAAVFAVVLRLRGGRGARRPGRGGRRGGRRARRGVSIVSIDAVFLWLAGFGIGGFFAAVAGLGDTWTLGIAAFGGVALAGLDAGLMHALLAREGSSSYRVDEFLGARGVVDITIEAGGVGRVRCLRGASSETLPARSAGGRIRAGSAVRVVSVAGSTVAVEPVDPFEDHGPLPWRR